MVTGSYQDQGRTAELDLNRLLCLQRTLGFFLFAFTPSGKNSHRFKKGTECLPSVLGVSELTRN